jgi:hypothetical protein
MNRQLHDFLFYFAKNAFSVICLMDIGVSGAADAGAVVRQCFALRASDLAEFLNITYF